MNQYGVKFLPKRYGNSRRAEDLRADQMKRIEAFRRSKGSQQLHRERRQRAKAQEQKLKDGVITV